MSSEIKAAIISAVVTIIVGVLPLGIMYKSLAVQTEQLQIEKDKAERERDEAQHKANTYRRQLQEAPAKFTDRLGALIEEASKEADQKEGPSQLVPATRALVSTRNSFRSSLESVRDRLDSEIDMLERELSRTPPNSARIAELVEVLKRKWPAKKEEIELANRKMLIELGLIPLE